MAQAGSAEGEDREVIASQQAWVALLRGLKQATAMMVESFCESEHAAGINLNNPL